jgi:hypothetical protein
MKMFISFQMQSQSVLCAFILACANLALAVPLADFNFTGAAGNEASLPSALQPANATVTDIVRGSGLTPQNAAGAFNSSGWTTGAGRDLNDFYSFSILPDAGYTIALTRIELDERRSLTGIREWAIYSSLDGFATALATFLVPDNDLTRTNQGVDLGSEFASLAAGVEFRIYAFGSEATGGTWRIDNVELTGEVVQAPVPVPDGGSSIQLLVLAFAALGFWVNGPVLPKVPAGANGSGE